MGNGQIAGFADFDPARDIPSLAGKVIFITGGTAGLGHNSISALAQHEPSHIYFTGRNTKAADALIQDVKTSAPSVSLTFVEMDMTDLASIKSAISKNFTHDRLDVLMCNAGVMAAPPGLSKDGFEIQFAINHLGNAMVTHQLLPVLLRTAKMPDADVRFVSLTSEGWSGHPRAGIVFDQLRTTQEGPLGHWLRYAQSKLANIVFAAELARRHTEILSVSVHPGVVETGLVTNLPRWRKSTVYVSNFVMGRRLLTPEQGCYNQVWCAAGAKREQLVNGAFYYPVGVQSNGKLDKIATSREFAERLWTWTEETLSRVN